jgi:hypothetical protein
MAREKTKLLSALVEAVLELRVDVEKLKGSAPAEPESEVDPITEFLDSEEFYVAMQNYRWSRSNQATLDAFVAVQDLIYNEFSPTTEGN